MIFLIFMQIYCISIKNKKEKKKKGGKREKGQKERNEGGRERKGKRERKRKKGRKKKRKCMLRAAFPKLANNVLKEISAVGIYLIQTRYSFIGL